MKRYSQLDENVTTEMVSVYQGVNSSLTDVIEDLAWLGDELDGYINDDLGFGGIAVEIDRLTVELYYLAEALGMI